MISFNATATIVIGMYVFGCIFFVYYCLYSSPENSETAYFLQITLPNASWNRLQRIFGDKVMRIAKHLSERILVLAYFTIVGGSWSIVFGKLYPWLLYESPNLSNAHAVVGVFVFLACFIAWAVANSSRPGIITPRSFRRYDHYPYDHLLFQTNNQCGTTKLFKIPRCKYDRLKYDGLVPRYDHFCGWTHNTYGEENYRWFILFLFQHVIMCFYGTFVSCKLFLEEIETKRLMELTFFDRQSGETIKASKYIVFQYMYARRTPEVCVTIVMFMMGIALAGFFGFHIYITSMGQTTNENSKWGDIKAWYKKNQSLYRTAIREGKVDPACTKCDDSENNNRNADEDTEGQDEQEFVDPGPIPKNLYNRGFAQNWKDVFFPLSLRKDALTLGGYTKASIEQHKKQRQRQISKKKETSDSSKCTAECSTNSSSARSDKPKDL
uniref:Palmitoyltransferase n=1 Tax=Pseudo-nitzschia australis TaxID=44445 RepID=A0A7S4ENF8_9STRA|mmetsp:Transcript_17263/g.37783  ORF Transcript_17263/g.37783 Transcript_17263/m.37783 type:complete len:438 (-) Transcript_17263:334-1647(-)